MARRSVVAAVLCMLPVACGSDDAGGAQSGADADAALRARAAELLPDVERLSGLPAREPLRLGIRSREDLEAFLRAELSEQFADDRIPNLVRVYARLGLVPDTLDVEPLLTRLLLEQVVGFYDPASDTLFVVEGVSSDLVDGVLVHEMVHALQDQYVDLDSLVDATRRRNDSAMAVQAAVEGHATFVMYEWMLAGMMGTDVDLTQMPRMSTQFDAEALAAAGLEMPELQQAPAVIREQLMFPYIAGLDYVQIRWGAPAGRIPPLADAMPATTEQILHPDRVGAPEAATPSRLDFVADAPDGWTELVRDGLGEADIRVLTREFIDDRDRADAAARGWDGDIYRLLDGPSGETLVWVSRWDSGAEADEFLRAADRVFERRYENGSGRDVRIERVGERAVRIVDAPSSAAPLPDELVAVDGV